jgi:hypothetical protein
LKKQKSYSKGNGKEKKIFSFTGKRKGVKKEIIRKKTIIIKRIIFI